MNGEISLYIVFPTAIEYSLLYTFTSNVLKRSSFDFRAFYKEDIDLASPIFGKLVSARVGLLIYDDGRLMRIDGDFVSAATLLRELDTIIEQGIPFFIRGSQQDRDEFLFPRGASTVETAEFLTKSLSA